MSDLTPRTAKVEEKEKKQYEKAMDAKDETFCGSIKLCVIDQDGYQRKLKGNSVDAPLHIEHVNGQVRLTAYFTPQNPLFFLEFKNESEFYLYGQLWAGSDPSASKTNEIGRILPKSLAQIHKEADENNGKSCAQLEIPFLKNLGSRLADIELTTVENRFKVSLSSITINIPLESWTELKTYRLRFWSYNKLWEAFKKDVKDDEEKDKDKKEE